jgi:hypothetical protein
MRLGNCIGLIAFVITCFALGGCSSDSKPSNQSNLRGKWIVELDNYCFLGLVFDGSSYEVDELCTLEDGSLGIEAEAGSYGASDDTIDFVPEVASCFLEDRDYDPYSLSYTVNSSVLRITAPGAVILLDKFSDDPNDVGVQGGAVARYGCSEADEFIFGELMPVN